MKQKDTLEQAIQTILNHLDPSPDRSELRDTATRTAKSLLSLTKGNHQSIDDIIKGAIFPCKQQDMVVAKAIPFYALCEHHLLPFFGHCHIGYIPREKLLGFSKLPLIIQMYSKRLQIQERMTAQIATALEQCIDARGVSVITQAQHLCMDMRDTQSGHSLITCHSQRGEFNSDPHLHAHFTSLLQTV